MNKSLSTLLKASLLSCAALLTACNNTPSDAVKPSGDGEGGGQAGPGENATFIMESEYVDFTGIIGGGNSCEKREEGMIYGDGTDVEKNEYGWSNGYFVAYTHKAGVKFTYNFTSDKAVTNATLVIRMASEMGAVSFGPDEFAIVLNDQAINYNPQYLENYPTLESMRFTDKTITSNAAIKAGANVLTLEVLTNNLTGAGTIGPILDCVKITSTAKFSWEPLVDNPDHRGEI